MRSLPLSGVLPGMDEHMMGGGMHGSSLPLGGDYPIFSVKVTRKVSDSPALPERLSTVNRYRLGDTANPDKPVPIGISEAPMAMLLNGRPYAFNDVQANERIPFDTVQLQEIFHAHGGGHGGGQMASGQREHGGMGRMGMMHGMGRGMSMGSGMIMMMSMAHPIHFHGQYF